LLPLIQRLETWGLYRLVSPVLQAPQALTKHRQVVCPVKYLDMSPDTDQAYIAGSATSQQLSTTKKVPAAQKRPHEGRVTIQDERPSKRNLVMTESGEPEQQTQIGDGLILPQPEFRNVAGT